MRLAELAKLKNAAPAGFGRQVGQVQWTVPGRLSVRRVHLTSGDGGEPLPVPPGRVDEVIMISPFLDGGFVGMVGGWGTRGLSPKLASAHADLCKLAKQSGQPLKSYNGRILALDAPQPDDVEPAAVDVQSSPSSAVEAGARRDRSWAPRKYTSDPVRF